MYLVLLLVVPLLIAVVNMFLFKKKVRIESFIAQVIVVFLVVGIGAGIALETSTWDTEVWSGRIASKAREQVSCDHSYPCHCHEVCSGSGKNRSCSEQCDTCYEHPYDVDWAYYTSEDGRHTVERIDEQGLGEPKRWDAVYVGEPTASTHSYQNYIKAAPDTVLRHIVIPKQFVGKVPPYPANLYDYYRVDRFVTAGLTAPDAKDWNYLVANLNADEGHNKQINVIVLAANTPDPSYEYAVEYDWIGGKKNDLIILVGTPEYPKIAWVRVLSWSNVEELKVKLRDRITEIGQMDRRDEIVASSKEMIEKYWQRRHMKDMKYLLASYQPGTWATVILFLIGCGVSIGISVFIDEEDENGRED